MFGFDDAARWAVEMIASSGGKEILKQQMTGFFGFGFADEVIMTRLINALKNSHSTWGQKVVVEFIDTLSPHQKTRLRHVLGSMLVPAPTKVKEMVAVIGPNGQPVQEKGNVRLAEKITETLVEYTDKDPRVLFLKHIAETLSETPTDATKAAAKQILLVTGAILDQAIIERIIAFGKKFADGIGANKDAIRDALFTKYGVSSYAELTTKLEVENTEAERKLKVRKNQFWMEWLWPSNGFGWTLFVTLGGLTGLGLIVLALTTASK